MIPSKVEKKELMQAVTKLLHQGGTASQEEIRQALEQEGIHVNQVRISRILHKLGAIKVLKGDKAFYELPTTELMTIKPSDLVEQMILSVGHNEVAIVIQTSPGSAPLVARMLDQKHQKLGILGTVAGDDTILVMPDSIKNIAILAERISSALLHKPKDDSL